MFTINSYDLAGEREDQQRREVERMLDCYDSDGHPTGDPGCDPGRQGRRFARQGRAQG